MATTAHDYDWGAVPERNKSGWCPVGCMAKYRAAAMIALIAIACASLPAALGFGLVPNNPGEVGELQYKALAALNAPLSSSATDGSEPAPCASSTKGDYGGHTSGAGFAPLVGVACSGLEGCYSRASLWSEVARAESPGTVQTPESCAQLCAGIDGCDVWTLWDANSTQPNVCELKSALKHPLALDGSAPALSGPRDCSTAWMPFPEAPEGLGGLSSVARGGYLEEPVGKCLAQGEAFASASPCVLRAYGGREALQWGVLQGWFGPGVAYPADGNAAATAALEEGNSCALLCEVS
mmetsp:Transcript_39167/g.124669  ORF Transcript_39167/g.124669 Transcript_39167/m.124669 type:complete len:295 (+) Transcript_39167:867-1751(+)